MCVHRHGQMLKTKCTGQQKLTLCFKSFMGINRFKKSRMIYIKILTAVISSDVFFFPFVYLHFLTFWVCFCCHLKLNLIHCRLNKLAVGTVPVGQITEACGGRGLERPCDATARPSQGTWPAHFGPGVGCSEHPFGVPWVYCEQHFWVQRLSQTVLQKRRLSPEHIVKINVN